MIDGDRLLSELRRLRGFGARGDGVVRRCLSPIDVEARHWLRDRMAAAGLDARIDGAANVIGRSPRPGPAMLLGSHSDTQPTGGWLDGAYGVICAIEVARALGEHRPDLAVDVASWADEESHYLGMLGSRSFCGALDDAEIDAAVNADGHRLRHALADAGLAQEERIRMEPGRHLGYLEAHIEQGPWLEREGRRIGVVTSIVGMCDLALTFRGEQNHAGTTPMRLRRDAAAALFRFAHEIEGAFADLVGEHTVWTIGRVRVEPNAPSIVPGLAEATLQFRDPDQDRVDALLVRALELVAELDARDVVDIEAVVHDDHARAVAMDPDLQRHLAAAAEAHAPGVWTNLPSGAGHDAQILATRMPAGMLFVPSIGGVSHDFAEDSHEDDLVLGCRVLAAATVSALEATAPR